MGLYVVELSLSEFSSLYRSLIHHIPLVYNVLTFQCSAGFT